MQDRYKETNNQIEDDVVLNKEKVRPSSKLVTRVLTFKDPQNYIDSIYVYNIQNNVNIMLIKSKKYLVYYLP
jgi:hypothetical protein